MKECSHSECDCVPAGHPVYDGFRITELWAIVQVDPADDQEGILYSQDGPLLAADTRRLEYLESVMIHAQVAGHKVALKHFKLVED